MPDSLQPTAPEPGRDRASRSQAVLDALADAETLRLFVENPAHWEPARRGVVTAKRNALREAVVAAQLARALESAYSASEAARHAFRAVPGLR